VLNIYDALYEYSDRITHYLSAHEQGAAHAADGYARASGKTGVVIATSGPGATNIVTGIATAYMDSIPLVAITGNVATSLLGRDTFQEIDITGVTMPITKHNFIVKDIRNLAQTLRDAFRIANSGRKGPVLVDITKDVTAAKLNFIPMPKTEPTPVAKAEESELERAAQAIKDSQKPLLYIGGGVISSNASKQLIDFAHKLDIPVTSSMMGLGGFPADDPLYVGLIGMHGVYEANKAAYDCDVLIVAGARFSDRVAGDRVEFTPNSKVIHIDIDPAEMDKNVVSQCHVKGDLKQVLEELTKMLDRADHSQWRETIEQLKRPAPEQDFKGYVSPKKVIEKVDELTDGECIIATDVGQHQLWAAQYFKYQGGGRRVCE